MLLCKSASGPSCRSSRSSRSHRSKSQPASSVRRRSRQCKSRQTRLYNALGFFSTSCGHDAKNWTIKGRAACPAASLTVTVDPPAKLCPQVHKPTISLASGECVGWSLPRSKLQVAGRSQMHRAGSQPVAYESRPRSLSGQPGAV